MIWSKSSWIGRPTRNMALSRYQRGGLTNPTRYGRNWNRSFVLTAEQQRGVAVLIHGLSDSPYSMKSTARLLQARGYTVIVPRMPGHGLAVGGLRDAHWEDWVAAVNIAIPFAPDDKVYGVSPAASADDGLLRLGDIAPRGERRLLALSPNYFLRQRHNPFVQFQQQRINAWLARTIE